MPHERVYVDRTQAPSGKHSLAGHESSVRQQLRDAYWQLFQVRPAVHSYHYVQSLLLRTLSSWLF
jgi:hypothetical protein